MLSNRRSRIIAYAILIPFVGTGAMWLLIILVLAITNMQIDDDLRNLTLLICFLIWTYGAFLFAKEQLRICKGTAKKDRHKSLKSTPNLHEIDVIQPHDTSSVGR